MVAGGSRLLLDQWKGWIWKVDPHEVCAARAEDTREPLSVGCPGCTDHFVLLLLSSRFGTAEVSQWTSAIITIRHFVRPSILDSYSFPRIFPQYHSHQSTRVSE